MAQKQKIKFLNTAAIFLFVGLFLTVLTYFGYRYVIQTHNTYTDFLIGETAYANRNKTGEWHVFWIILFVGMILTAVLAFLEKKDGMLSLYPKGMKGCIFSCVLACFPMLTELLIYGKTHPYMICATALFCVVLIWKKEKATEAAAHFLILYFATEAISVLMSVFFNQYFLGDKKVLAFSVLCFAAVEVVAGKKKINTELFYGIIQLFIPLLLLAYTKDTYQNSIGEVYKISFPLCYRLIVWGMILCLIGISVFRTKKEKSVFFSTVFSVFAFVSYISPAMILPSDLHHHGEQVLPWQQIVQFSQKPYADYAPASGLFPMLIGFFQNMLFGGKANAYGMSYVLFALLFEALTMYLLWKKIGGKYALFLAFLFHMPVYCRGYIILPTLLLLSDKKLIENKTAWLLSYVFVCFLDGLYYPLYGAALLLGGLPFAFLQLAAWIKKPDFKKGHIPYLAGLLGVIGISLPMLFRMLKHVLAMGSQTVNVDGESIFLAEAPEWFMPYLSSLSGYDVIYAIVRFLLAILPVCLTVYLFCRFFKGTEKRLVPFLQDSYYMLSAMPAALCVCYTYTMVCMDEDWVANLLSRSAHVLTSVCGMFLFVFLVSHGKQLFGERKAAILIAVSLSVPFIFFYQYEDFQFPFMEGTTDGKDFVLFSYQSKVLPYSLRDEYVLLTDEVREKYPYISYDRIGEGYAPEYILEKLNKLNNSMNMLRSYDEDVRILGFQQSQFYYYLLDEKAVYTGRTAIAGSKRATKPLIEHVIPEHTVVGTGLVPLKEYYLYRYLLEYGYAYSADCDMFLPKELYRKINGSDRDYENSVWTQPVYINGVANSFAKSLDMMKDMQPVAGFDEFTAVKAEEEARTAITFEREIHGEQADFIYLKINSDFPKTKGSVYWIELVFDYGDGQYSQPVTAWLEDGELLFPVGINANWFNGAHKNLILHVFEQNSEGKFEEIENVQELSIEELQFYQLIRD